MYKEYTIDPKILTSFDRIRALLGTCGWHKGKMVCEYPKKWKRKVYDTCQITGDREKKILEEFLSTRELLRRKNTFSYDEEKEWIESAKAEHYRKEFTAIVSDISDPSCKIIDGRYITEENEDWAPPSCLASRTASDFAATISLLAQNSSRIIFIDPHFQPNVHRFTEPFAAMLEIALRDEYKRLNKDITFELHVSEKTGTKEHMENYLPDKIPDGLKMRVFQWKEHDSNDCNYTRLHNRYFLTDIGGLIFGIGLDIEKGRNTVSYCDDINILSKEQHKEHLKKYHKESSSFTLLADFEIMGTRSI